MSQKELGTENIEKLLKAALELAIVAKKVLEDGKVSKEDIAHALLLVNKIKDLVEAVSAAPKALDEVKDLDIAEIVSLIQKVDDIVKKVEEA